MLMWQLVDKGVVTCQSWLKKLVQSVVDIIYQSVKGQDCSMMMPTSSVDFKPDFFF